MRSRLGPSSRPHLTLVGDGQGAAGGPPSDGMEARLAKVEAAVEHIDRDVSRLVPDLANVRERFAALEERVAHLPSKGFIVSVTLASLAVVAALIAFSDQIQALVR